MEEDATTRREGPGLLRSRALLCQRVNCRLGGGVTQSVGPLGSPCEARRDTGPYYKMPPPHIPAKEQWLSPQQ